jgi:hypothetical protein
MLPQWFKYKVLDLGTHQYRLILDPSAIFVLSGPFNLYLVHVSYSITKLY